MISLEKLNILTPLQKLPKNVGDLGTLIVAKGFKNLAQSPINRPILSLVRDIPMYEWKSQCEQMARLFF